MGLRSGEVELGWIWRVGVAISYGSGGGLISRFVSKCIGDFVDETFESEDVLQKLAFVAFVVGHSARGVQLEKITSHQPNLLTNLGS